MIKTYKYKLKPTKAQAQAFDSWLNTCRYVYNLCLEYKKTLYQYYGRSINKNEIQKELKDIKNITQWIGEVHSQTLQDVTDRLFLAYDNFFRKGGYPRFAKKDKYLSFIFKQGVKVHPNTNTISFPKIGKVKFFKSQDVLGTIKQTTIIKEHDGWYVCLAAEYEPIQLPKNEQIIGIDLGIKDLMITSESEIFGNPKTLYRFQKELAKSQRALARKVKGSNNRERNIHELQKIYAKIKRIRKDHLHKITTNIINENQVIICEDLRITNMLKNHKLAKSISDASWGLLMNMFEYKSQHYGRTFVKIAPQYTSKDCNICQYRNDLLTLADRSWTCPICNVEHDRDINAAINIMNKGINKLSELGHNFVTCGDIAPVRVEAQESHVL